MYAFLPAIMTARFEAPHIMPFIAISFRKFKNFLVPFFRCYAAFDSHKNKLLERLRKKMFDLFNVGSIYRNSASTHSFLAFAFIYKQMLLARFSV